jgi:hypothetical protein
MLLPPGGVDIERCAWVTRLSIVGLVVSGAWGVYQVYMERPVDMGTDMWPWWLLLCVSGLVGPVALGLMSDDR